MSDGAVVNAATSAFTTLEVVKMVVPVAVNVCITGYNIYITKKDYSDRRANDRKYQSSMYLYQSLLVDKICDFVSAASKLDAIFRSAQSTVASQGGSAALLQKFIASECDKLDSLNTEVEISLIRPVICIAKSSYKKLQLVWEQYYDVTTDCTTKLSGPVDAQLRKTIEASINSAHEKFIAELSACVREFHPAP